VDSSPLHVARWHSVFLMSYLNLKVRIYLYKINTQFTDTVAVIFRTHLPVERPCMPEELFVFGIMAYVFIHVVIIRTFNLSFFCGIGGALFVATHRAIVTFVRTNQYAKQLFQHSILIYPGLTAFLFGTVTFPLGTGKFIAGKVFGFHFKYNN
jgi:chloride channel 2